MMSQRLGYLTSWGQTDGNPETETHEHVASCQMYVALVCWYGKTVHHRSKHKKLKTMLILLDILGQSVEEKQKQQQKASN